MLAAYVDGLVAGAENPNLANWADIAQIVLAAIAALALAGAAAQILLARAATRQTLTYNYTERFANPEMRSYIRSTQELFALGDKTADEKWREFKSWPGERRLEALVLPNLLEEMAGMYNRRILHRQATKDFFGYTALRLWTSGEWLVKRMREESNPNYYIQWEQMLKSMKLL
jgi:hypothetical protein